MQRISELAPEVLDAEINKWTETFKSGCDPEARSTLKTLLLEKERRKLVAFTPTQLVAAIRSYETKVKEGHPGTADVLKRLVRERNRREQSVANRTDNGDARRPQSKNGASGGTEARVASTPRPHAQPQGSSGAGRPTSWKRITRRTTIVVIPTLIIIYALGSWYTSWHDESDFAAAMDTARQADRDVGDIIEYFEWYLRSHVSGAHVSEAADHQAYFQALHSAREAGSDLEQALAGYERYIERDESGRHVDEARDHIAFLSSAIVEREAKHDTKRALQAYQSYLASYPQGQHAEEASDHVDFFSAEGRADNSDGDPSEAIDAYEHYLAVHRQGKHVAEATEHLAFLRAVEEVRQAGEDPAVGIASFRRYLASYPKAYHLGEARDRADFYEAGSKALSETEPAADAVAAYEQYLAAHPDGHFADEARRRIERLAAVKALGFFIAEELPGPGNFVFDGRSASRQQKPFVLANKQKRYLVIVASIRSAQFIPTETKYQELKTKDADSSKTNRQPYPPRDHIRFYDAKQFWLILADGRTYQSEMFGDYSRGFFGCTTESFISGAQIKAFYKSAPNPNEFETLAIVFVLDAEDCEPPFKLGLNDRQAVVVPSERLPAPRGR